MSLPEAVEAMGSSGEVLGSKGAVTRRSALKLVLALTATGPLLAACGNSGFRPLYGSAGIGAQVDEKLARVEMTQIPGRVGQRIRNEFIFLSTGGGNAARRPTASRSPFARAFPRRSFRSTAMHRPTSITSTPNFSSYASRTSRSC